MSEKFFDTSESTESRSFNKPMFLSFSYGTHLVRILGKPSKIFTHFLSGRATLKCLDDECPICQNNSKIKLENPKNFWTDSNWYARNERHYMNVLDRTPVKVCPNCQTENKKDPTGKFSTACYNCETFITEKEPINSGKVKVVNLSKTNAEDINAYNISILNEEGNPLGVHNFDIMFFVGKTDRGRKKITPSPVPTNNDKVEVPEDALFDLDDVVIELDSEEIISLLQGVTLRDIFSARRDIDDELVPEVKLSEEASAEVNEKLDELFKVGEE
jgi:hypothetical protein